MRRFDFAARAAVAALGASVMVNAVQPALAGSPGGFTFDDIEFWVGEGSNEAGFVVDLADGGEPIAWGFRWDGLATGLDMFKAIAAADGRFFAKVSAPGEFGVSVFGIGLDADGDGSFALSDGTVFTDGIAEAPFSDDAVALDREDRYVEGWFENGYWGYWAGAGEPYSGGSWGFAPAGPGDRVLADGDWDGWAFAPGFVGDVPAFPVAALPPDVGACPADLNTNGIIDSADLNILLASFGCTGCFDLTGDGAMTSADLNILLADFGAICD